MVVNSYRNSFFNVTQYKSTHNILLASARAGNVIGGGDWALDRLIPDLVKATAVNKVVDIRSQFSIRPWQHVLEPLSGYLLLGQKLLEEQTEFATGWNFGPLNNEAKNVEDILLLMKGEWDDVAYQFITKPETLHEAKLLKLDCRKANTLLSWHPIWNTEKTVLETILWYKNFYQNGIINSIENLKSYISDAISQNAFWTK